MTTRYDTVPCRDCGQPTDPRWLGRCRACEPSLYPCVCGQPATTRANIGGWKTWRCADCTTAAEQQADADVAEALANGATWLMEKAREKVKEVVALEFIDGTERPYRPSTILPEGHAKTYHSARLAPVDHTEAVQLCMFEEEP